MRSVEHIETLFDKYYGFIYLYTKWYTVDPDLEFEIIEKTFVKYIMTSLESSLLPVVHLLQIASEIGAAMTKDVPLTLEESNRRSHLFAFLNPILAQDRDLYFERFYRNATDAEISIKFAMPEHDVRQKIKQIAKVHAYYLYVPVQLDNGNSKSVL